LGLAKLEIPDVSNLVSFAGKVRMLVSPTNHPPNYPSNHPPISLPILPFMTYSFKAAPVPSNSSKEQLLAPHTQQSATVCDT
jgi:hypothetical protein